jgi:hypothetical protein
MKRIIAGIVLTLGFIATSWALVPEQFFRVHDFTHAARISEMTRAISDGHFPVRWSQNLGYGYGMPLFNFYAPLPYYVGSVFYGSGLDIVLSIKVLFVISNLVVLVGSYKLGRLYFGRSGALLLAVLITLAPYRALNLYVRGALSESWALSFLPWILYYAVLVMRGVHKSWMAFAVSLAGLALTHNITLILAFPMVALFVAIEWLRIKVVENKWHWQRVAYLAAGGLLALGLAAFYLFPAFAEKNFTQIDDYILDYYFSYQLHFLYIRQFFDHTWGFGGSGWGPDDDISFGLGVGQLVAVGLTGLVALAAAIKLSKKTKLTKLVQQRWVWLLGSSAVCIAVSLLMTLEKTLFIWQSIPILKYAQFPWRWLTVAVPFIGLLGVIGTQLLTSRFLRHAAVFVLILITFYSNTGIFRPEKYLEKASDYYSTDAQGIREGMSSILPDYIPKGLPKKITSATSLVVNESELPGKYTVLSDRTHQKLLSVNLTDVSEVTFAVADFPGWTVEIDGVKQEKQVSQNGLIVAKVPAGEHLVGINLELTTVQWWSQAISLFALLFMLAALFWTPAQSRVKK